MTRNLVGTKTLIAAALGAFMGVVNAQTITEFSIPTAESGPSGIVAGPDGNLWFTENQRNQIGRITPAGVITEFPIPTQGGSPRGIAVGSDGSLWFTESGNKIGRITTTGVITEFTIPAPTSMFLPRSRQARTAASGLPKTFRRVSVTELAG